MPLNRNQFLRRLCKTVITHGPEAIGWFTDYDGTTAPIVADAKKAAPDTAAAMQLLRMQRATDANVVVITGRLIDDFDRLLQHGEIADDKPAKPLMPHVSGTHGTELRKDGEPVPVITLSDEEKAWLTEAKTAARALAADIEGKYEVGIPYEEKPVAFVLHTREAHQTLKDKFTAIQSEADQAAAYAELPEALRAICPLADIVANPVAAADYAITIIEAEINETLTCAVDESPAKDDIPHTFKLAATERTSEVCISYAHKGTITRALVEEHFPGTRFVVYAGDDFVGAGTDGDAARAIDALKAAGLCAGFVVQVARDGKARLPTADLYLAGGPAEYGQFLGDVNLALTNPHALLARLDTEEGRSLSGRSRSAMVAGAHFAKKSAPAADPLLAAVLGTPAERLARERYQAEEALADDDALAGAGAASPGLAGGGGADH